MGYFAVFDSLNDNKVRDEAHHVKVTKKFSLRREPSQGIISDHQSAISQH